MTFLNWVGVAILATPLIVVLAMVARVDGVRVAIGIALVTSVVLAFMFLGATLAASH